jgi:hypothetical protein
MPESRGLAVSTTKAILPDLREEDPQPTATEATDVMRRKAATGRAARTPQLPAEADAQ